MHDNTPPAAVQPRVTRWMDGAVQIVLIALLAFGPFAFGMVDAWSELVGMVCCALVAVLLVIRWAASREATLAHPALLPIVIFVALAFGQLLVLPCGAVQRIAPQTAATKQELLSDIPGAPQFLRTMTLSFYPAATRHDLRVVLIASVVFAGTLTSFRTEKRIGRLLAAIALIGLAMALLALTQDVTRARALYWKFRIRELAVSGAFYNHSHFGQFMNLSLGAALGLLLMRVASARREGRSALLRSWWLVGFMLVGAAAVLISLSRGAIIAMGIAGAMALAAMARRRLGRVGLAVAAVAAAALGLSVYLASETVVPRLEAIRDTGSLHSRLGMARDTLRIWKDYPIMGIGLGTYEYVFPAYDRSNDPGIASHAENEYVQVAAETGAPGLAIVLLFVGIIWRNYFRAMTGEQIGAIGLGYAVAAVMIHSLSDFGQHVPANACLAAAICACMVNLDRGHAESNARTSLKVLAAFGLMTLLAACAWGVSSGRSAWLAEKRWDRADDLARALERRDWRGSDEEFRELLATAADAINADPDDVFHSHWRNVYRWKSSTRGKDPQTGEIILTPEVVSDAKWIVSELNQTRRLCPTYAAPLYFMGQIEDSILGQPIGVTHIRLARRLVPNNARITYRVATIDASLGRWDDAREGFRHAARLNPGLITNIVNFYLRENQPARLYEFADGNWDWMLNASGGFDRTAAMRDWQQKSRQRAIELLAEAADDPNAAWWVLFMAGDYVVETGRYDQSAAFFRRGFAMPHEERPGDHLQYAQVLFKLGRREQAIAETREALRLQPAWDEALKLLTEIAESPQAK